MKRIGIAHGAIRNAGDYLIYKRGFELIKKVLGNKFEYVEIRRWKPIKENLDLDAIIILGGPIISRKIHPQAKNIYNYIQTYQPNIPLIALGVGISGQKFESTAGYFLDSDSIEFWKRVSQTSGLLSVRDKITKDVLEAYGIKSYLTGCPALYSRGFLKPAIDINKILVTLPNISHLDPHLLALSLVFLCYIRLMFPNKEIYLLLQHGNYNLPHKLISIIAKILEIKSINGEYRSIDEIPDVRRADVHVGCRLHTNIFFLSQGKPSYLLNIDNRTNAFLQTINILYKPFSIKGIIELINEFKKDYQKRIFYEKFKPCYNLIKKYNREMNYFLIKLRKYLTSLSSNKPTTIDRLK